MKREVNSEIKAYVASAFSHNTWGFQGLCSFSSCNHANATHMRRVTTKVHQRFIALCPQHAGVSKQNTEDAAG